MRFEARPATPLRAASDGLGWWRQRSLARLHNLDDVRLRARTVLPKLIFDYIDGGADAEITMRRNRSGFDRATLIPRLLDAQGDGVAKAVELFGHSFEFPLGIAPTGLAGAICADADVIGARAARSHGIPFVLSTLATSTMESVAATEATWWFQLYHSSDRTASVKLLRRAEEAGAQALVVTIDGPALGNRERDARNGFNFPPRASTRLALDVVRHPRRAVDGWRSADFPNLRPIDVDRPRGFRQRAAETRSASARLRDCQVTWTDLRWLRRAWSGPLLVKGVLSANDAHRALEAGSDALIVSNHGGRQLDGASGSLEALQAVVSEVGGSVPVLLDGGVRRGSDVVKALAVGASACFIGRPWLYGLAAGRESGVGRVLDLLEDDIHRTLMLLGVNSVDVLDPSWIRLG